MAARTNAPRRVSGPPQHRVPIASPVSEALADRYLIEEMKQVYEGIRLHQNAYVRLETFSFAGIVAAYGFLLSTPRVISPAVWWIIPALIMIGSVRSIGHYVAIRARNGPYLARLERMAYGANPSGLGFQAYLRSAKKTWIAGMSVVIFVWAIFFFASIAIAVRSDLFVNVDIRARAHSPSLSHEAVRKEVPSSAQATGPSTNSNSPR